MSKRENETKALATIEPSALAKAQEAGSQLTDAAWARRDADIQDQRNAQRRLELIDQWNATKSRLLDVGLGERHLQVLFENDLQATPAISAISTFEGDGVFILSGNVGCGKTLAAHAWLLQTHLGTEPANWSSRGICMITAAAFARTSRYSRNDEDDKFDILSRPKRLVIDDLGVEFNDEKGSFRVDIDELLDLRWRAKKPTVITTNLTVEKFKDRYGPRVYDRSRGSEGAWKNVKHDSLRG